MNSLKIVSAYRGMAKHVEMVKANSDCDFKQLWAEIVIATYWDEWAAGQFNEKISELLPSSQPNRAICIYFVTGLDESLHGIVGT